MKAFKKHFIATLAVLATVATSLAGVLFKAPVTTNAAEGELFRESFTFAEAVGAISYTEEELAATGMTLSGGVLGGATSNLTAEQLAVKENFYKTAYGRSPLKYYMAYQDAYAAKEYWQWAIDKSNSWKFSYMHIGGLSAGHQGTTDSRINAGENHRFYSSESFCYVYSFVYEAPVDGTLTISKHTLGTSAAIRVGYAKSPTTYTNLSPSDTSLGWVDYAAGEGSAAHIIPAQTFELNAGERVYISFDTGAGGTWAYYNPTFSFVEKSTEVEETQTKDFAIDFEDAVDATLMYSNADDVWVWPQAISSEKAHNGKSSYKVTPRPEGNWPNVVFGSTTTGYHDLTKAESISVWVYFDSNTSESVSNLGIKVSNHVLNADGKEVEGERYEKKYTIPSKTWTKLTLKVADLQSSNVDLTKAYVKFSQLGDYVDRSVFYLDDFAVVYPKTEGDDVLIDGYEKGERLAYVQYSQMIGKVGSGKGAPVNLCDSKNNALVAYNFKQGSVEKGMSLFDTYAYNYVGKENSDNTRSAIWKLYLNHDVAFIYEVVAKQTVFIDITNQVKGVDGATSTTEAWLSSSVLRMYIKGVDGNLTKLYEYSINDSKLFGFDENGNPVGLEVSGVLLEAGETFYYELYKYYDGRNLSYPPYLNVYEAKPIYHSHEFTKVVENEVAATCETAGSYDEVEKCSCGAEQNRTTIEVPALGHGVQKGERLAFIQYTDMVWFVGNGQGQDVALKGADGTELVTYNFKHGSVENGIQNFGSYATDLLGPDSSYEGRFDEEAEQNKKACSLTWKIYVGNNDAFIYQITAKQAVYVDLKAQVKGVDNAPDNTGGWFEATTIRVYIKGVDGKLTKLYDYNPTCASGVDANGNPIGAEVLGIYLNAGETLYYEYNFPWTSGRNMSCPPYLSVYAASGAEKVLDAVAPTCTATGLTEGKACARCGKVLVAQQEVPALGHTEAEAVKENEVPATCAAAGSYDLVVYCATCGAELSRTTVPVDALGHTEAEAVKENVVPATCTAAGSHDAVVYCATCGAELSRTTVADDALGHDEVVDEAVEANCVTVGLTEGSHCSRCGEVFVAQEELGLGDHSYGEWEIVIQPEGPNDGLQKKTCEHCGHEVEEVVLHDEDWDVATIEDCQGSITTSSMAIFGLLTAVVAIVRKKRS